MVVVELVLPFPSPSQNQLDRWHWSKKRRLRDQCRLLLRSQMRIRGLAPESPPRQKRCVEVVRTGAKLLDYGNLVGGFKPILDAMTLEFLLHDDSPDWVSDIYRQVQSIKREQCCTRITVSEVA